MKRLIKKTLCFLNHATFGLLGSDPAGVGGAWSKPYKDAILKNISSSLTYLPNKGKEE